MSTEVSDTQAGVQTRKRLRRTSLRAILKILGLSKTVILALALLASLALNVATVTLAPVFNTLSSAVERVVGNLATVRGRQAQKSLMVKKTVRQTTQRISRRVAKATVRSVGSAAAESIPFLGVGVLLGVTALEISDACATMGDLHQLELALDSAAPKDEENAKVCGMKAPTKEEVVSSLRNSPGQAWDKAMIWVSDLPSWKDTKGTAKDAWGDVLEWIRTALN